mgnify:CR=1 FL=1
MLKKVKEILDKRSKINDEDDYRIEKCRDELIDALSQDELLTIDILNQLNEKEILYTSEVFEEIAYNLQSVNYINCLKYIEKKYPSLDIKDAIEVGYTLGFKKTLKSVIEIIAEKKLILMWFKYDTSP